MSKPPLEQLAALAAEFTGIAGFACTDLVRHRTFGLREHEVFPTASAIKLAILVSCAERIAEGAWQWQDLLTMGEHDQVGGSGVLKDLSPGLSLTLRDLATLMIIQSDNTATNMLIDRLGLDRIAAQLAAYGLRDTHLHRKISFDPGVRGAFAHSTPSDLNALMQRIAQASILTPRLRADVLDILERQQWRDLIPRYLPFDPYPPDSDEPRIRIANKTGFTPGVRTDVAYVHGPTARFTLAVMTRDCKDLRFHPENEAAIWIGRLARVIYDHLSTM